MNFFFFMHNLILVLLYVVFVLFIILVDNQNYIKNLGSKTNFSIDMVQNLVIIIHLKNEL